MSRYTNEFKQEAVRLMTANEKPIAEISRELGVKRTEKNSVSSPKVQFYQILNY